MLSRLKTRYIRVAGNRRTDLVTSGNCIEKQVHVALHKRRDAIEIIKHRREYVCWQTLGRPIEQSFVTRQGGGLCRVPTLRVKEELLARP